MSPPSASRKIDEKVALGDHLLGHGSLVSGLDSITAGRQCGFLREPLDHPLPTSAASYTEEALLRWFIHEGESNAFH